MNPDLVQRSGFAGSRRSIGFWPGIPARDRRRISSGSGGRKDWSWVPAAPSSDSFTQKDLGEWVWRASAKNQVLDPLQEMAGRPFLRSRDRQ